MKKAILIGTPHHNNLGDHAIVVAEKKYIEDNLSEYQYYEISEETVEKCIDKVKKHISYDDIIFYHGGGNLGDEYLYIEEGRRKIVQLFPNNKIIFFPQTIYFSKTKKGEDELKKSKEIYSKHKDLTIIAREKTSYKIMKKEFPNNNILETLDIVLYLNKTNETQTKRDGVLFILRSDIESKLSKEQIEQMEKIVKKYFNKIEYSDTAKGQPILEKDRESRLEEMFERYRKTKLVITDRLHGMIFAAITSTPCIALDNYNHKIKACSETLENLDYIKYIDNIDAMDKKIEYLLHTNFCKYNNSFAIKQFKEIIKGGI